MLDDSYKRDMERLHTSQRAEYRDFVRKYTIDSSQTTSIANTSNGRKVLLFYLFFGYLFFSRLFLVLYRFYFILLNYFIYFILFYNICHTQPSGTNGANKPAAAPPAAPAAARSKPTAEEGKQSLPSKTPLTRGNSSNTPFVCLSWESDYALYHF